MALARIHVEHGRTTSGSWPLRLMAAVLSLVCLVQSTTEKPVAAASLPPATPNIQGPFGTATPYQEFEVDSLIDEVIPGIYSVERPLNTPVNVTVSPAVDPITQRANATLLMLAQNSDIEGVESSMHSLESAFNHKYHYPWTFLNEVPFTLEFKKRIRAIASGDVQFGLIKSEHWYPPDWIDEERYEREREKMEQLGTVPYAGSMTYRNMCRFNSGFFFRQEVLDQFKWYWRVEPEVEFPCKIPEDPFVYMIENNKRYGFTVTIREYIDTIPTLWSAVKEFTSNASHLMPEKNALSFISDDGGESYNRCHFWSNFEIADLDFFRSSAYLNFFSHLDSTGGFFYERWGDAPVHSIGATLLLPASQLHYLKNIGYYHPPMWNCPAEPVNSELGCSCKKEEAFEVQWPDCNNCLKKFEGLFGDDAVG